VPLLTCDVRLTERIGFQAAASVPDVTRSAIVQRAIGPVNFRETFRGMGDMSVLGWYRARPARLDVVFNAGTSLPTGRTERPRFRAETQDGSLVPMSRLQRGSGTVDPLFGVNISRRVKHLTVFSSLAARTPLYENEFGLRTGAAWEVNGGAARELGTHRLAGFARLGWLHRAQDVFRGTPVLVGGGDWIYLTPCLALQIATGTTAQVEVKVPVYRNLANTQLDSSAIVQFGISRAF
jgi:hypothetical protein